MKKNTTSATTIVENQKESKTDAVNLASVKINVSKIDKSNLSKERITTEKNLYLGMEGLSSEEKKKFRGKIRRDLGRFVNQILGKDRSDEERANSIREFLEFYSKNWKVTNFKIDDFSQSKNEIDLKDYRTLLHTVQSALED